MARLNALIIRPCRPRRWWTTRASGWRSFGLPSMSRVKSEFYYGVRREADAAGVDQNTFPADAHYFCTHQPQWTMKDDGVEIHRYALTPTVFQFHEILLERAATLEPLRRG